MNNILINNSFNLPNLIKYHSLTKDKTKSQYRIGYVTRNYNWF